MNRFTEAALAYLAKNQHIVVASGAAAAELMGINQNTLKSRINSDRALAMRDDVGRTRASIDFTGFQLVYNMLFDRLAAFNVTLDDDPDPQRHHVLMDYALYTFEHVISGERNIKACICVVKQDGQAIVDCIENMTKLDEATGEAALILPIGSMVVRLAAALMSRNVPNSVSLAINA